MEMRTVQTTNCRFAGVYRNQPSAGREGVDYIHFNAHEQDPNKPKVGSFRPFYATGQDMRDLQAQGDLWDKRAIGLASYNDFKDELAKRAQD